MKAIFSSGDKRFEAEIIGSKLVARFDLPQFQGEFNVKQLPLQAEVLKASLLAVVEKIEQTAAMIRKELGDGSV